ncbi:MAG: glycosyltransferase [Planctomycetota bacterium]
MQATQAIVLSPAWPGSTYGYELAIASSLASYARTYRRVLFCCITEDPKPPSAWPNVELVHVPIRKPSKALRFFKSLASSSPAITQLFRSPGVSRAIALEVGRRDLLNERTDIIFEDLPVASLAQAFRTEDDDNRFVMRSHNVVSEAFEGFEATGNLLSRLAWKYENARIRRFEKHVLESCDSVYTITARDLNEYRRRYQFEADGVLGVDFDQSSLAEKAQFVEIAEDPLAIVHLGTVDLRKGHGIREFVEQVFRPLRVTMPALRLVLGGRNSEQYHSADNNIEGHGFIDDEGDFLCKGRIFVNPQKLGTGVKIKSLVAMSYGRVLVTTPKGIEGIDAVNGEHCFVAKNNDDMVTCLQHLMDSPDEVARVSHNAYNFVLENYCRPGDAQA